jgi:chromosome segregation ATPase
MATRSPVAQVEVEAKMRKVEADIEDLKGTIKDYEAREAKTENGQIELLKAITAGRNNLHDLYEELKALRQQQQGNEPKTQSYRFTILYDVLVCHCILLFNATHM